MSSQFQGEGNVGSDPQVVVFPVSTNSAPQAVLRLNVFFDNPVPGENGQYEDKGGFWAPVEIVRDAVTADRWGELYQRGMRVMVSGKMLQDTWTDKNTGEKRMGMKVRARAIGILPYRLKQVEMAPSVSQGQRAEAEHDLLDDDSPF